MFTKLKKIYPYSEIDEITNPEDVDLTSFDLKDELNSDFWHEGKLDIYARKNLLQIAKDMIEGLDIGEIPIEDIIMTGSLANYNWNENYSDIDLHIVVDFSEITNDETLLKSYFDSIKKSWNQKHDALTIYGYPVEIYFQDKKEKHTSSGVYSVLFDKWVIEPSKEKIKNDNLDKPKIKGSVSSFMNEIDDLIDEFNSSKDDEDYYDVLMGIYDKADDILDRIKDSRKSSLNGEEGREMTDGNLIFKSLRRNGYLEKLFDLKKDCYDIANSL